MPISAFRNLGEVPCHYRRQETEGNFPGANSRVHFANYNPARGTYIIDPVTGAGSGWSVFPPGSPWLLETMSEMWDSEGGKTARTDFCCHAGTAVVSRRRVRRPDTGAPSGQDLVAVYDLENDLLTGPTGGAELLADVVGYGCAMRILRLSRFLSPSPVKERGAREGEDSKARL